ncbi:hypothetical protein VULLAG_LOCUS23361 [Vulpes lagopus]
MGQDENRQQRVPPTASLEGALGSLETELPWIRPLGPRIPTSTSFQVDKHSLEDLGFQPRVPTLAPNSVSIPKADTERKSSPSEQRPEEKPC